MFKSASNFANSVDAVFLYIVGLSLIVLIGITVAMIYFVIKYNRKKNPVPENISGNLTLEILWTTIPLVLFLTMFYFGWTGYQSERDIPKDAMDIKVTARMWQWSFEYPNGLKTDTLYVPQGKAVKADLRSMDVNHSFFIPQFRVKKDVIPTRKNNLWFRSDKIGMYDIVCAEYCGLNHAYMRTSVHIMKPADFSAWFAAASKKAGVDTVLVAKSKK